MEAPNTWEARADGNLKQMIQASHLAVIVGTVGVIMLFVIAVILEKWHIGLACVVVMFVAWLSHAASYAAFRAAVVGGSQWWAIRTSTACNLFVLAAVVVLWIKLYTAV